MGRRESEPSCDAVHKALRAYEAEEGAIDRPLFERVGSRIRQQGYLGPDDLYLVVVWKSPGRVAQENARQALLGSTPEEIQDTTKRALDAVTKDKSTNAAMAAIGILDGLPQVGVPFASAILTFFDPDSFGAIDENAWRALGWPNDRDWGPEDYGRYLARIREIGKNCNLTPRQVDAALYFLGSPS